MGSKNRLDSYTLNSSTAFGRKCSPASPLARTTSCEDEIVPYAYMATGTNDAMLTSGPVVTVTDQSPANDTAHQQPTISCLFYLFNTKFVHTHDKEK